MELTEKSIVVLNYVKGAAGKDIVAGEIAEALNIPVKSVNGTLTALGKKGLIVREEGIITEVTVDEEGNEVSKDKKVKFIRATELASTEEIVAK